MKTVINLLPPMYRRQRLARRRAIQWSIVLASVLGALVVATWYKVHESHVLDRRLAAAEREGLPSRNRLRQISAMRKQIEKLQKHQTVAQELEQQRQVLALLGVVSQAARQTQGRLRVVDCRVVDLQATEVDEHRSDGSLRPGTVTVTGVALDSPSVAGFEQELMRSGLFADVKLIKSVERNQLGPELFDYEVRCEL
jgi:Tfp pilus assembly protein PilN